MRLARKVRLLPNKQQENKLKEILKSKEQIENIKFDKNILDSIYIEKIGKIKTSEKILKEICIQSIKIKQYKDKIYMFYDFKIAKKKLKNQKTDCLKIIFSIDKIKYSNGKEYNLEEILNKLNLLSRRLNRLYNSKKRKEKLNLEITRNLKKNNEKIERKLKKIDMIILNESHKISNFIVNQGYKEIEIINMNFKNEKILSVIKKQLKYKCKLYKVKIFGI